MTAAMRRQDCRRVHDPIEDMDRSRDSGVGSLAIRLAVMLRGQSVEPQPHMRQDPHTDRTGIQVYGTDWCGLTSGLREYLTKSRFPYHYYNIEDDPRADEFVLAMHDGRRRFPVVVVEERIMTNPTLADLRPFTTADRFNFAPFQYLLTPSERYGGWVSVKQQLTDTINLRIKALYIRRNSENKAAYEPLFATASDLLARYRKALDVRHTVGADLARLGVVGATAAKPVTPSVKADGKK